MMIKKYITKNCQVCNKIITIGIILGFIHFPLLPSLIVKIKYVSPKNCISFFTHMYSVYHVAF